MQSLIQQIVEFNKTRHWDKVNADGLAKSIILEAAELLEHFQWGDKKISRKAVGAEVADIFIYLVSFCHAFNLSLPRLVAKKLSQNANKYPVGSNYYRQKKLYRQA